MSIEGMFDDLEARFAHLQAQERRAQAEDLVRAEWARVSVKDRLRGALDHPVRLHVEGIDPIAGRVQRVGADHVELGDLAGARLAVVPWHGVLAIEGLPRRSAAASSRLDEQTLTSWLRETARDHLVLRVESVVGSIAGARVVGVGADAVDLTFLGTGESPGADRRGGALTLRLTAVRAVLVE
ncbi:hypothetical protein JSY14_02850 [Brachybacterium sp. EF45031]|uniref:hypothetical protein n=1 Tax=Brachybacterium sillae TaxID=2810536 RepID=UPI00217E4042|nr:hypothetical protein [Brachybacterium sillae]MCS6711003.1 hypothetical protein [Brachybacterium sillae]